MTFGVVVGLWTCYTKSVYMTMVNCLVKTGAHNGEDPTENQLERVGTVVIVHLLVRNHPRGQMPLRENIGDQMAVIIYCNIVVIVCGVIMYSMMCRHYNNIVEDIIKEGERMGRKLVKKSKRINGLTNEMQMVENAKDVGMEIAKIAGARKVNFSIALRWMHIGVAVRRDSWDDCVHRLWIKDNMIVGSTYQSDDLFVKWIPDNEDLLASDWVMYDPTGEMGGNNAMD